MRQNVTMQFYVLWAKKWVQIWNMGITCGGGDGRGVNSLPISPPPILSNLCQWRWKNNMQCYTFNTPNSFCFIGIRNILYVFKAVSYTKIQVFCTMLLWHWLPTFKKNVLPSASKVNLNEVIPLCYSNIYFITIHFCQTQLTFKV